MTAHLTDAEISRLGESHARECWRGGSRNYRSLAVDCREDFKAGARFARDRYEKREALWRELVKELSYAEFSEMSAQDLRNIDKLRAALGLEGA